MTLKQFMVDLDQESTFQAQVIELARRYGWLCFHAYDARRSEPGYPDLTLVKPGVNGQPGRLILAELKSQKGRVRPAQTQWLDALRSVPGIDVQIWRPSDLQRIATILSTRRDA